MKVLFEAGHSTSLPDLLINVSDVESITLDKYEEWYRIQGQQLNIPGYNITACSLEEELKQVQNTTRCFILLFSEENVIQNFLCLMFWVVTGGIALF